MTTQPSRRGRGRPSHPDILTPREWQVLALLRDGLTNEQIAQRLDISFATAKYHVAEIISKLGVATRDEAAAWQPEAVPVRWWQRALAWVPRRAWPLAGAAAGLAVVAAVAWFILGTSAGEEGDAAQSQASRSPGDASPPAGTPTPQDVTFAPLSISNPQDTKLLFIRGATGFLEPGSLWMSDLDGSHEEVLIPEPIVERVFGVVNHWQTGNPTVYYYNSEISEENTEGRFGVHTVFSLDLATRQRVQVHSYELRNTQLEGAEDITDDGRYLAYADNLGLAVLDTANGKIIRVLESDPPGACSTDVGRCLYYAQPAWSPDSSFLLAFQGGYEGGVSLVLNPFDETPMPVTFEPLAWRGKWSPSGQSLCLVDVGDYDHEVGIIIARAPDWKAQKYLTEYQPELPSNIHVMRKSLSALRLA